MLGSSTSPKEWKEQVDGNPVFIRWKVLGDPSRQPSQKVQVKGKPAVQATVPIGTSRTQN